MKPGLRHLSSVFFVVAFVSWAGLRSSVAAPAEPDFYRDVYPFLKANCISCHNKTTTKAALNMETPALMKKGGDSGPSIIPGKSAESLIVEASIHSPDFEMPPPNNKTDAKNLSPAEIAVLKKWIDLGAKDSVKAESKVVWQALDPGVHPIYTLAMTKDGRFAAAGRSNQISIYDLATQEFVTQVLDPAQKPAGAHRALVHSLAYSPDGARLASGGYREVKIWQREAGAPLKRKGDPALGAVVSTMTPDGKQIVSVDKSGTLSLLNAADGKVVKKVASVAPTGARFLSVSPDGGKVAVFAGGWNLSAWNLADGTLLAKQTVPDPTLEKQVGEAQAKLAAAVKAEADAGAAVKTAQTSKAAAAKALAEINAAIAAAATPELQKQLADANAKAASSGKAEAGGVAAAKTAQANVAAATKAKSDADAAVKIAQAATTKTVGEIKAKVAAASNQDLQKVLADSNTKAASVGKAEAGAVAAAKAAQAGLTAAVKAEADAGAALKVSQASKAADAKALAGIKAAIAAAATPEFQKQLADANAKVASAGKAEAGAVASLKAAQAARANADKSVKDAAAKLDQARKIAMGALAWTADSKAVITGGEDKVVRVWPLPVASATTFSPPKQLAGATGGIVALASGPDLLVAAGKDNKMRVWSLSGAKMLREIPLAGVLSLSLSPDGKLLASGGSDSAIRIWDVATGKQVSELRGTVSTTREVAALEWTLDVQKLEQDFQKTVVAKIEAQDKALDVLLKKAEDAIVAMTKALPVKEKEIKPKEDATAAEKKKVEEARAAIAKAPEGKADAALEKALKAAQDKLITAETAESSARAAFKAVQSNISDAEAQVKRITATKAENAVEVAAAKAAGDAAKALHAKATADLAAVKKAIAAPGSPPLAVAFSGDSKKVAAKFGNGALNVWAVPTGIPIEAVTAEAATTTTVIAIPDGTFLSCDADASVASTGQAVRWKLERVLGGDKELTLFADRVNALQFSPNGKTLAAGGGEPSRTGELALFDVASGKPKASWKELHDDTIVGLDFSHDGKLIASGAADKIVRVIDLASGKQVNLFEGHTHYVMGVDFRADDRVLATAGADGVVNAWDMLLGERKKKIEGWSKEVTSLQFIGATNQIVTSAGDNLIRIVNDNGTQIRSIAGLPDFMQVAASTADGATIIGGGEDSFLRVWNGSDGKEITAFGALK